MITTLSLSVLACVASDTTATQRWKLASGNAAEEDRFGHSVAVEGTTAVVGAIGDDAAGPDAGSLHIFERGLSGWRLEQTLVASRARSGDWFGYSSDLAGGTIVVGAPRDDEQVANAGAVHVFEFAGGIWSETAKLNASDASVGAAFGHTVSLNSNRIAVGAWGDSAEGTRSGAVYIFHRTRDGWREEAKLLPGDSESMGDFGRSVSLEKNRVLVGKVGDGSRGNGAGAAYLFERHDDVWQQVAKLLPEDGARGDRFGASVSLCGETLVIGAPADDEAGASSGSAYVFGLVGGDWMELKKLVPLDGCPGAQFGSVVKIDAGRVVIGASNDSHRADVAGSVYEFVRRRGLWNQRNKFVASDAAQSDGFGWALDFDGDVLIAGAHHADSRGRNSGSAYLFGLGERYAIHASVRRED